MYINNNDLNDKSCLQVISKVKHDNDSLNWTLFTCNKKSIKSSVKFCPWKGSLPHLKSTWHSTVLRAFVYRFTKWCVNTNWIFLKALFVPCQSFRNIFKSLSSLSLGTFLLIRYETSFLNLKAHFLQYKKNNSTLNCTHNNFFNRITFTCKFMKWIWIGKKKEKLD